MATAKPACRDLIPTAMQTLAAHRYDAVVLLIGSIQLADWRLSDTSPWTAVGDPTMDARYVAAARTAIAELATAGVPLLIADLPPPDWDPNHPKSNPRGASAAPGSGPLTINDPERARVLNALAKPLVAEQPLARVLAFTALLAGPDGIIDADVRFDGLHLGEEAVAELMDGALLESIRAGYLEVTATGTGLEPRATTWRPDR